MSHRIALAGVISAAILAAAPASFAADTGGAQAPNAPETSTATIAPSTAVIPAPSGGAQAPSTSAAAVEPSVVAPQAPAAITALVDPARQQLLIKRTRQLRQMRAKHNKLASKIGRLSGDTPRKLDATPVIADPTQALRAIRATAKRISQLRQKLTYWTEGPGYWIAEQRKIPAAIRAALRRVASCESGLNYRIANGNGFYGAYQFDYGTWRGVGGYGTANQASPAEQDVRAYRLYLSRGWAPWPHCGRLA